MIEYNIDLKHKFHSPRVIIMIYLSCIVIALNTYGIFPKGIEFSLLQTQNF